MPATVDWHDGDAKPPEEALATCFTGLLQIEIVAASYAVFSVIFDVLVEAMSILRPSQAMLFSENFLSLMRKARQMQAFLITDSGRRLAFERFGPRIPESFRPQWRIHPFSGDSPWRP